jgi:hypothetical protein
MAQSVHAQNLGTSARLAAAAGHRAPPFPMVVMSMSADATVFTELRFGALVLFSAVLPAAIFVTLFVRRKFSKGTVLVFGLLLIVLAGVDVFLLHELSVAARTTPSLADDVVFSSALSIALYILPAALGTFGINMVSHVLMHYLRQKEKRFEAHRAVPSRFAAVPLHPKTQA